MTEDTVDDPIGTGFSRCGAGKKKKMSMGNEDAIFSLMRTGGLKEGCPGVRLFDVLYMPFAEYRKLSVEEKKAYIGKERKRVQHKMRHPEFFRVLLQQPWGYTKLEQGVRDVYYRLCYRFDKDPENGRIGGEVPGEPLDRILDDLLTSCPPAFVHVWLQIISPKRFETNVLEPMRQEMTEMIDTGRDLQEGLVYLEAGQRSFVKYTMEVFHQRIEKWVRAGDLVLDTDKRQGLYDAMRNFCDLIFQCGYEWVLLYYKNIIGEPDETAEFGEDPLFFLTMYSIYLPFDCIVIDAATQSPCFDSVTARSSQAEVTDLSTLGDYNVIVLLYFSPDDDHPYHEFESVGLVSPSGAPLESGGGTTCRLSRIFSADDPFILHLRDKMFIGTEDGQVVQ